ncbi:hypothetical protein BS47DRAFT_1297322 [Hydnum rufescens UP504]|uniref:Uncharacterized protein n=1 Tax=Hydnum rufescens UP504 TaxID=1448309 RepID=A0A9P6AVD0_9AGAM|nr:hypothetical protein BS47DRAFT_1297322 [Hydnum rufescens UP504]
MMEAGEKQYYILTLIDKLFKELPINFTVSFLYDIACQLHHSMSKWGLLPEWFWRIIFGIPALHVYGHQYVCQIMYHPHKVEAFGRTDGEGTERVWSLMSPIIRVCQVSGFHRRLYTIDAKFVYLDDNSLWRLGSWLQQHHKDAMKLILKARGELSELSIGDNELDTLAGEWNQAKAYHQAQIPSMAIV